VRSSGPVSGRFLREQGWACAGRLTQRTRPPREFAVAHAPERAFYLPGPRISAEPGRDEPHRRCRLDRAHPASRDQAGLTVTAAEADTYGYSQFPEVVLYGSQYRPASSDLPAEEIKRLCMDNLLSSSEEILFFKDRESRLLLCQRRLASRCRTSRTAGGGDRKDGLRFFHRAARGRGARR